jgi:hypothetical protein
MSAQRTRRCEQIPSDLDMCFRKKFKEGAFDYKLIFH